MSQLESSVLQIEQARNLLERRFNSTRSFDMPKEQESYLLQQNEENQAIISADNAT